jgi:hypothetical protein
MPAVLLAQGPSPAPAIGAAGRPLPQTSLPPAGSGPFLRYARANSRPGYTRAGDGFTAQLTNPLASAPGYLRWVDLTLVATGGSGVAAVASADAPANVVSFIQFKDPWGTPIVTGDGYAILSQLNRYGGQGGYGSLSPTNKFENYPTYSAIATSGNFTFHSLLPLEGTKGYGVISIGNASVMPSLVVNYTTAVYSTQPTGAPTIATTVDEFYYDIDPSNPVVPPGNGSTFQTAVVQASQTIGTASSTRVQLPRTGGYLTSVILILRDNTSARVDAYNSTGRLRVYIDGVPRFDETFNQAQDRVYSDHLGISRDAGVMPYTFKKSLNAYDLGYLDTLEQALQTNPGTLIEVEMTPWGTISNSPGTLYAVITQLVPSGPIAQGLPEV